MAQTKVDSYEFVDDAELINVIEGEGYVINDGSGNILSNNIITDTDPKEGDASYLDMHYLGQIPLDELEPPTMSDEVYCTCARAGAFKIPSQYKAKGQLRKYIQTLNIYGGEPIIPDEEVILPTMVMTKAAIIQWLTDNGVPEELWNGTMTKEELIAAAVEWFS